jgi:hypothetical protein
MKPPKGSLTTTALRLVAGDGSEGAGEQLSEHGFEAPTPRARPADRCEPWPVEDGPQLRALAAAAASCGISTQLAAVLVVERVLLEGELAAYGRDELTGLLDAAAGRARVAIELSEPLSAYFAALSPRRQGEEGSLPQVLALPMRLTERIGVRGGCLRLEAALLASALAWERAAVLEGRTMSEWAFVMALGLGC